MRRRGFTLIELLVVIAIIAILAALAIPNITAALTSGQLTQTLNNAKQLHLATTRMVLDSSVSPDPKLGWPGDIQDIQALYGTPDPDPNASDNSIATAAPISEPLLYLGATPLVTYGDHAAAFSLAFGDTLDLDGTGSLRLAPVAQQNEMKWSSDWPHPSFGAAWSPDERSISAAGARRSAPTSPPTAAPSTVCPAREWPP